MYGTRAASGDQAKEEALVIKVVEKLLLSDGFISKITEAINKNINQLFEKELKTYVERINNLEDQLKSAISEKDRVCDELEQYSRRNSLRIYGIPTTQNEKTDDIVIKMCKEKLGVDIDAFSIDRSHRLSGREGQYKPLIVRFVSHNIKQLIYSNKKKLRGTKVIIREDLTSRRNGLLRSASNIFGQRNVWSIDGKIMVKNKSKIYKIMSTKDLNDVQSKCSGPAPNDEATPVTEATTN